MQNFKDNGCFGPWKQNTGFEDPDLATPSTSSRPSMVSSSCSDKSSNTKLIYNREESTLVFNINEADVNDYILDEVLPSREEIALQDLTNAAKNIDNLDMNQHPMTRCYPIFLRERLNYMRKRRALCDTTVHLSDRSAEAHSLILRSNEIIFPKDKQPDNNNRAAPHFTINLPDITYQNFDTLVEYMYVGTFSRLDDMTALQLIELNHAAQLMGLTEVNLFGKAYCRNIVSTKNYAQMWNLAFSKSSESLLTAVEYFILKHFDTLLISLDLRTLTENTVKIFLSVAVNQPHLQDAALGLLLTWANRSPIRWIGFSRLVEYIDLSKLSKHYLQYLIQYDYFVQANNRFKKLLERAHVEQLLITHQGRMNIGTGAFNATASSKSDIPIARNVSSLHIASDTIIRSSHGSHSSIQDQAKFTDDEDWIYEASKLISSSDIPPDETTGDLLILGQDILTGELHVLICSPSNRRLMALGIIRGWKDETQSIAILRNRVYIMAGEKSDEKLTPVYVYNLEKVPNWSHTPRLVPTVYLCSTSEFISGGVGKVAYTLAGMKSSDYSKKSHGSIIVPRKGGRGYQSSACTMDSTVYVVGGGTPRCSRFNHGFKRWKELPQLPDEFGITKPLLVTIVNDLFVFSNIRPDKIYMMDTYSRAWRISLIQGDPPDCIASATCIGQKIYTLDHDQKLYSFDAFEPCWNFEMNIPRKHFRPLCISPWQDPDFPYCAGNKSRVDVTA